VARTDLHHATGYANRLLLDLGATQSLSARAEEHPALRWAQCGAMSLTGYPDEAPQMCPIPLACYADGIVAALGALRPGSRVSELDGAQLLGERAACANLRRAGDVAAGGSCRLLRVADDWIALNLARGSDWELLPAWLEAGPIEDWTGVAAALAQRTLEECLARARELGLPAAPLGHRPSNSRIAWCRQSGRGDAVHSARAAEPLVIDLSSLWAGPLCAHLMQLMGARVIKVESCQRPDGLRQAGDGFYDLLNAGKASVVLDFNQAADRSQLRSLLGRADIVIEASRPRALRQLGIVAEQILRENPGLTWISISGYGRLEPAANWVAFGDDGAVAGGLSQVLWDCTGRPMFCADAIADPLTGLHAALAAWAAFAQGGGRIVSLALCDVIAHCIQFAGLGDPAAAQARARSWQRCISVNDVAPPHARAINRTAPALGADTPEILAGLAH
jgi:CoA-transferase family III